ncbi:Protein of unknown function DUF2062 [Thermovibrio ammonificans HB-1]|uniref:DUF2062 domain-containing protein n=1 Tax=Thermovibrio ammonificans (strain DSM 15698 / JCM 12110 / HB-1) TaxID=648996 RepID=E8T5V2_THEA1|nr:DUF2062 domain-containing protein [Thermovibrio ammonificans]ADU97678.1 Protein of unknown function DUF2062 [Thermovibrio ammonificans HB-1]
MKGGIKSALSPKFYLNKLLELKERSDETAKGLALGVFIGFLPIIGFQVIVAVTIATLTRASKVAAAVGTHVTNPWTTIPILIFDYYVGCFVMGRHACFPKVDLSSFHSLLASGKEILVPMFVGGVLLGSICSVLSYFGIKRLLERKVREVREYAGKVKEQSLAEQE